MNAGSPQPLTYSIWYKTCWILNVMIFELLFPVSFFYIRLGIVYAALVIFSMALGIQLSIDNICAWSIMWIDDDHIEQKLFGKTSVIQLSEPVDVRFIKAGMKKKQMPRIQKSRLPGFQNIYVLRQIDGSAWIAEIRQGANCIRVNPTALVPRVGPDSALGALGFVYKAYADAGRL